MSLCELRTRATNANCGIQGMLSPGSAIETGQALQFMSALLGLTCRLLQGLCWLLLLSDLGGDARAGHRPPAAHTPVLGLRRHDVSVADGLSDRRTEDYAA